MQTKTFSGSRLRKAEYEPAADRQLDLYFDGGSVLAYKHVPEEVWRKLCAAPNPATYWEDRIAEEYPKGRPRAPAPGAGGKSLGDLFREAEGDPPA